MDYKEKKQLFESILEESENNKRRVNHLIARDMQMLNKIVLLKNKIDAMIEKIDFSLSLLKTGSIKY